MVDHGTTRPLQIETLIQLLELVIAEEHGVSRPRGRIPVSMKKRRQTKP